MGGSTTHASARSRYGQAMLGAMLLVGCSSHGDDPAGISADDQRQLNEAAAMLDANSIDAHAVAAHESSPHD